MTSEQPRGSGYDDLPPMGLSRGAWRVVLVIVGNVFVLVGVAVLGWSLRDVLLVYWAETVTIGVLCMLRWLLVHGPKALPMVGFFTVHFGVFSFVHLVFLIVLTSGVFFGPDSGPSTSPFEQIGGLAEVRGWWLVGLGFLVLPHVVAMVRRTVAERRDAPPMMQFGQKGSKQPAGMGGMPYGRVVVMHVAILGGAFLTMALGSPIWLLVILVVLKTGIDLGFERFGSEQAKT